MDPFYTWIGYAVAGWLDQGNIAAIEVALSYLPEEGDVVEVGSYCGLSSIVILHALRKYKQKRRLICCDNWSFEGGTKLSERIGESELTFGQLRTYVKAQYVRNVELFAPSGSKPIAVELDSDVFFDRWNERQSVLTLQGELVSLGGPIAFAYIDGNHRYGWARSDFEGVDADLVEGGFILFDDTSVHSPFHARKAVQDVLSSGAYELVSEAPNLLLKKKTSGRSSVPWRYPSLKEDRANERLGIPGHPDLV